MARIYPRGAKLRGILKYEVQLPLPSDLQDEHCDYLEAGGSEVIIPRSTLPFCQQLRCNDFSCYLHLPWVVTSLELENAVNIAPTEKELFWGADYQARVSSNWVLPVDAYFEANTDNEDTNT